MTFEYYFFIMWSSSLKIETMSYRFHIRIFQIYILIENNCLELETRFFHDIETIFIHDLKILNISSIFLLLSFSQKVHFVQFRLIKSSFGYWEKSWCMLIAKPNSISFVVDGPSCLFWGSNLNNMMKHVYVVYT